MNMKKLTSDPIWRESSVVAALIVHSGRMLLGLRSERREFYPNVWDMFGGHLEKGEMPEHAMVRELEEELGITPTEWTYLETLTLPLSHPDPQTQSSELTVYLYRVTKWKGTPYNRQPEEHSVIHWFSVAEARELELADASYPGLFARYVEGPAPSVTS
jgi:8-oxo-dGTP diphosphatase